MMNETYRVYIKVDEEGRVICIDGGITESNIKNVDEWILIDEGTTRRHKGCQVLYLSKPVYDENFIYNYKYEDGKVIERTEEEKAADIVEPVVEPTQEERIAALEQALEEQRQENEVLIGCLLEISELLYS